MKNSNLFGFVLVVIAIIFQILTTTNEGMYRKIKSKIMGFAPDETESSSSPIEGANDEEKDRKWQIAVLCEPNPITYMSGQASRFRLLLEHFSNHCHDTHELQLITAEAVHPSPPRDCFDGKIPIHYTLGYCPPMYNTATLSLDITLKSLRVLFPFRGKPKVDLIHVSSPGNFLLPAIVASQLYQIPLLMSYHTHLPLYARSYVPPPWNGPVERLAWWANLVQHWFADLTLVTSPQMAAEFREHYGSFAPSVPIRVWKKGVDTTRFHPDHRDGPMRTRMTGGGNPDDFLLVYIGRLGKEKQVEDLRDVLEELNRLCTDPEGRRRCTVRLCIVGDGPHEEFLRNHFEGTPTVFLGRLDGTELSQAFASGDVFCMPSESETLGFVVLESMASGVPCVAVRAGGPVDLIDDGTTGYLVPPGNAGAFADRLDRLRKDPDLRRSMSVEGRRETERWSWYASMDEIRDRAYPQCIENFRTKRVSQRLYRWLEGWIYGDEGFKHKRS